MSEPLRSPWAFAFWYRVLQNYRIGRDLLEGRRWHENVRNAWNFTRWGS